MKHTINVEFEFEYDLDEQNLKDISYWVSVSINKVLSDIIKVKKGTDQPVEFKVYKEDEVN